MGCILQISDLSSTSVLIIRIPILPMHSSCHSSNLSCYYTAPVPVLQIVVYLFNIFLYPPCYFIIMTALSLFYLIFEEPVFILLNRFFFLSAVAILSNSVGSCDDRNFESAAKTEKMMKLPVIRHLAKKPSCLKEVRGDVPTPVCVTHAFCLPLSLSLSVSLPLSLSHSVSLF